jgi:hypothetical protein
MNPVKFEIGHLPSHHKDSHEPVVPVTVAATPALGQQQRDGRKALPRTMQPAAYQTSVTKMNCNEMCNWPCEQAIQGETMQTLLLPQKRQTENVQPMEETND